MGKTGGIASFGKTEADIGNVASSSGGASSSSSAASGPAGGITKRLRCLDPIGEELDSTAGGGGGGRTAHGALGIRL